MGCRDALGLRAERPDVGTVEQSETYLGPKTTQAPGGKGGPGESRYDSGQATGVAFAEAMMNMASIQQETLKSLARLKGGRPGDDGDGSESDEYGQESKFAGPKRLKCQVMQHPDQVIDKWLGHIQEQRVGFRAGTN